MEYFVINNMAAATVIAMLLFFKGRGKGRDK